MSGVTNVVKTPGLRLGAAASALVTRMMSSDAPQRFGTASGHSGWM